MIESVAEAMERMRQTLRPTPMLRLNHDRVDLHAKLEHLNPTGSVKDRSAFWILTQAISRGEITRETIVVESSSGNFAVALASACRWLGISFIPVVDINVTAGNEELLRTLCSRVEKVVTPTNGGLLQARLARVDELRRELPSVYWPNQYENRDAMVAHYRFTGGEICEALPRVDYIFVGVSTAGTIAGLSRRIKDNYPGATVVAVDAEGSAIFGGPNQRRFIPGMGSSIVPGLVREAQIDQVVMVPEREAVSGCHELLARYGLFTGGSTGSVYAAIRHYFANHTSTVRPVVVFLCADRGTTYLDTVYDPRWVETTLGAMPSGLPRIEPMRVLR
jgi:cysteine synthase A